MRCLIQHAKKCKEKLFLIVIDFGGAFDRVSRATLNRKLVLFGSGTIFTLCMASIYMSTESIIYQGKEHRTYNLNAGIKQGLHSLMLYVIIVQVYSISLNILIHADDATLLATTRAIAITKVKSLLFYWNLNSIIPQYSKCFFVVINGGTDQVDLPFGNKVISDEKYISAR